MSPENVLNDDEVSTLSRLVDQLGEVRAAESLKLSRTSTLRLLLRRPVRNGTITLARVGLASKGAP